MLLGLDWGNPQGPQLLAASGSCDFVIFCWKLNKGFGFGFGARNCPKQCPLVSVQTNRDQPEYLFKGQVVLPVSEAMSCHPKSSAGYGVLLTTLSQNKQAGKLLSPEVYPNVGAKSLQFGPRGFDVVSFKYIVFFWICRIWLKPKQHVFW